MDRIKYILLLCLFLFGGTLAVKSENDNDMKDNDLQGLIDIDEDKGMYHGSGDKQINDDDEMMMDYSGREDDDDEDAESEEWEEMGSAEMEKDLTDCKRLKVQTSKMKDLPYIPKCTDDGLFERVQCNFNYEECFCVDEYGRKIIGTSKYNSDEETRRTMCDDEYREIDIEGPTRGKGVKSRPGDREEEEPYPEEIDETVDQEYFEGEQKNSINNMNGGVEVDTIEPNDKETNEIGDMLRSEGSDYDASNYVMRQPGLLAAIIGGTVVGLLCAVLLVMFIVYRMRKKDEGSYALDEPKRSPSHHQYQRASNREFYA